MVASFVLLFTILAPVGQASASTTADAVIAEARKHMGTPYRYGGTTPSGFDCSGFVRYVFNKNGIHLPRTAAQQYGVGKRVSKSELQKGDIVFFSHGSGRIHHNGIYIGNGQFIHSATSKGISIASINGSYWGPRYVGAKRVIEEPKEEVKSEQFEPLPAGEYHDVSKNHWAYGSITRLGKQGIVSGNDVSLFKPGEGIKRSDVAEYLVKALDIPLDGKDTPFTDVSSSHPQAEYIRAASEAGFINGNSNGEFMPNDTMSRQQMAVIFYRAFDLKDETFDGTFVDVGEDHMYAKQIYALAGSGITAGNSKGEFEPNRETTRAHFTVFLERALRR